MDVTDTCKLCEKIVVTLDVDPRAKNAMELPNTYDAKKRAYAWKFHEFMAYALIPQSTGTADGNTRLVDMFLCIDEDDLDDIDVQGFATKFFHEHILPGWKGIKHVKLSKPVLAHSDDLECRKLNVYQKLFTR